MGILSWILLGLIAGAIAKAIHPGPDPGGWIITILLGIGGAIVGGFIGSLLGLGTVDSFSLGNLLLSVAGAIILLWLYRWARKR
ncbi:MAG: GlsB/YeaQ/YmgE family stress response membrane protein [Paludibacteraceae bacterium]